MYVLHWPCQSPDLKLSGMGFTCWRQKHPLEQAEHEESYRKEAWQSIKERNQQLAVIAKDLQPIIKNGNLIVSLSKYFWFFIQKWPNVCKDLAIRP